VEDGSQRERGLSELSIQYPNDLRKIGAHKGLDQLVLQNRIILLTFKHPDAGTHRVLTHVYGAEAKYFRFQSNFGGDSCAANRQLCASSVVRIKIVQVDAVTVNALVLRIRLKQPSQCVMRCDLAPIDDGGFHEFFVNDATVFVFGNVAFRKFQTIEKRLFQRFAKDLFVELECAGGVLNDLRGLNA